MHRLLKANDKKISSNIKNRSSNEEKNSKKNKLDVPVYMSIAILNNSASNNFLGNIFAKHQCCDGKTTPESAE